LAGTRGGGGKGKRKGIKVRFVGAPNNGMGGKGKRSFLKKLKFYSQRGRRGDPLGDASRPPRPKGKKRKGTPLLRASSSCYLRKKGEKGNKRTARIPYLFGLKGKEEGGTTTTPSLAGREEKKEIQISIANELIT